MRLRKEKAIVTIYDAVSILKGFNVVNGSLTQNYYAESATYVPNRYIIPLVLRPKIDVSDPNNVIENGDKVNELARLEWFENGVKINSNDDFKIEGANLTVFKNSEEPFEISYRAEWFDSRKKQVITIEDSVVVSCISLAQSDANVTISLSKPQNWVHNPLKGERIYTINAYVSKDKVNECAVEWYYVDSNKNDVLIDDSCSFYVDGQYTNALKVDSAYMDNVIIKAKNISNDKLKEVYWFFDKHGNPLTYAMPDKTIIEGSNVFSLPESPITSKLDYRIGGLTLTNLVQNGNFSDEMKGWKFSNTSGEINSDGNVVMWGGRNTVVLRNFDGTSGTLACRRRFKIRRGNCVKAVIQVAGGSHMFVIDNPDKGIWIDNTIIQNTTIKDGGYFEYKFIFEDDTVENKVEVDYVIVLNLTQTFGAGNEPTKEWCDEHISGYFEGTKSVNTPLRIKSEIGGRNYAYVIKKPDETTIYVSNDFPRNKKQYLSLSLWGNFEEFANADPFGEILFGGSSDYGFFDYKYIRKSVNHIIYEGGYIDLSLETDKDLTLTMGGPEELITKAKIELGTKATDWTPAPEDNAPVTGGTLYINNNLELKSVGEVKDYIENGKLYKNVQRFIGVKDLKWQYILQLDNGLHRYSTVLPIRYRSDGEDLIQLCCNNYPVAPSVGGYLKETDIGFCLYYLNTSTLYVTTKEKLDDPSSLFPEDTFIDLLLEQTEVINLNTSGSLQSYPNGTIFIEPATLVEQQYNSGLQVDLPVKTLGSIKVGKEYLDVSKAVVNDNLITHPDIENGDFVSVEYIYDDNPIYGDNSISYLSLEEILDDLWLDNVYTYKVTNGEWELVKVTDIEDYEEWLKTEKTSPYTLAPDGVIFGSYEAETKFIRQYPSSLYVDIIAPTRLKEGITQIKARALVGTADGVIENPSKYFHFVWYRKENQAGAVETIIGHGEEIEIDIKEKDMIGVELQSLGVLSDTKTGDDRTLTDDENRKITLR